MEKSGNTLLIEKTFWKSIILPLLLYGTNIINLRREKCVAYELVDQFTSVFASKDQITI